MNTALGLAFDATLSATLLWLAWRLLASPDLFRAVVLFIAFGLLLAIAWIRLEAPDVALAEAAIGAGVTGALLLMALARMAALPVDDRDDSTAPATPQGARFTTRLALPAATVMLTAALVAALLSLTDGVGLGPQVSEHLADSGVEHAVTAVLLNFRAWDTLLELAVLLVAVLGVWSLRRHTPLPVRAVPGPVLPGMVRLLLPAAIVIGIYLLWAGAHAPGGAFQAGAVLGAAGVLWILSRPHHLPDPPSALLRLGVAAGVLLFVAIGAACLVAGPGFLDWPPARAKTLIVVIELAATLSIALTLVALFLGGAPRGEPLDAGAAQRPEDAR